MLVLIEEEEEEEEERRWFYSVLTFVKSFYAEVGL